MTSYWIEDINMTIYTCMSSGHLAMLRQHSYQYKAHMTNIRNLLQAHLQPLCSASLWILILPLILLCLKSRLELGVPGCLLLFVQIEHYTIIFNLHIAIFLYDIMWQFFDLQLIALALQAPLV